MHRMKRNMFYIEYIGIIMGFICSLLIPQINPKHANPHVFLWVLLESYWQKYFGHLVATLGGRQDHGKPGGGWSCSCATNVATDFPGGGKTRGEVSAGSGTSAKSFLERMVV